MWPNVACILESIHFSMPRVPKVSVTLFRENHSDGNDNFLNFKVTLKTSYQGTASQQQLNQYLASSEQERL